MMMSGMSSCVLSSLVDDVSFIVSLAEYLQNEYGYDANNTFAAGMSNGAEIYMYFRTIQEERRMVQ